MSPNRPRRCTRPSPRLASAGRIGPQPQVPAGRLPHAAGGTKRAVNVPRKKCIRMDPPLAWSTIAIRLWQIDCRGAGWRAEKRGAESQGPGIRDQGLESPRSLPQLAHHGDEHPAHFVGQIICHFSRFFFAMAHARSNHELRLNLADRPTGVSKGLNILSSCGSPLAFSDIAGDRNRRSPQLTGEAKIFASRK